jgi:sporulation protein YlmC with PRC-barrel domain
LFGDTPVTRILGRFATTCLVTCLATALPLASAGAQQTAASDAVAVPSNSGNPNLSVATVRLENGVRLSKIIGSAAYTDPNTQVGTVDDLIMTKDDKVVMAVISVGGVLGVGGKLVAVPFTQLSFDGGKTMLAGATKDSLNAMPNFTY